MLLYICYTNVFRGKAIADSAKWGVQMQIAVCDDNIAFLREIEEQLRSLSMVDDVFTFSNDETFLFSVDHGKRYDAILLDIEWNRQSSGIDIAEELHKTCPDSKIIFVTGYNDRYSQHIFLHKINLSGLLIKPVDTELLRMNLQKVAESLRYVEQPALVLQLHGRPVSIPLREIDYIESKGHTVEIHLTGEMVKAYMRLESILCTLPTGFCQCHKSYIVNMSQIRRFENRDILLKNGKRIPISRARYAKTKEDYFRYIGQSM